MLYLPTYMASQLLGMGFLVKKMKGWECLPGQLGYNQIGQQKLRLSCCQNRKKKRNRLPIVEFSRYFQMNSSRNSFELMFYNKFIILQSVVTRYLVVQKVMNWCIVDNGEVYYNDELY